MCWGIMKESLLKRRQTGVGGASDDPTGVDLVNPEAEPKAETKVLVATIGKHSTKMDLQYSLRSGQGHTGCSRQQVNNEPVPKKWHTSADVFKV